jgi:hypothetical protein
VNCESSGCATAARRYGSLECRRVIGRGRASGRVTTARRWACAGRFRSAAHPPGSAALPAHMGGDNERTADDAGGRAPCHAVHAAAARSWFGLWPLLRDVYAPTEPFH